MEQPLVQKVAGAGRVERKDPHTSPGFRAFDFHPKRPLIATEVVEPVAFEADFNGDRLIVGAATELRRHPVAPVRFENTGAEGFLPLGFQLLHVAGLDFQL